MLSIAIVSVLQWLVFWLKCSSSSSLNRSSCVTNIAAASEPIVRGQPHASTPIHLAPCSMISFEPLGIQRTGRAKRNIAVNFDFENWICVNPSEAHSFRGYSQLANWWWNHRHREEHTLIDLLTKWLSRWYFLGWLRSNDWFEWRGMFIIQLLDLACQLDVQTFL